MYKSLVIENAEIKNQVQELLERGDIQASSPTCGSPIVLVPKKNGRWRMCVDYRELNRITIKNMYNLTQDDDLLDEIKNEIFFTKLDL